MSALVHVKEKQKSISGTGDETCDPLLGRPTYVASPLLSERPAASYLLRGALHGLNTVDSVSFSSVSLVFLAIALLAAYVPSRRAMGVDPIVALRYE